MTLKQKLQTLVEIIDKTPRSHIKMGEWYTIKGDKCCGACLAGHYAMREDTELSRNNYGIQLGEDVNWVALAKEFEGLSEWQIAHIFSGEYSIKSTKDYLLQLIEELQ